MVSLKKSFLNNTLAAIINQAVALICAFILPRQLLIFYGSEVNGLVSSIGQFLSFVSLLDFGISSVVQATLYKPIAENDLKGVSKVLTASQKFFQRIGIAFIIYTAVLAIIYPAEIESSLGYFSTVILIVAISFSSLCEYLFGITNQVLLNADQKAYVQLGIRSLSTILNTVVSIILMHKGASIVIVKIFSSLIFALRPFLMMFYIKRHYDYNYHEPYDDNPIKQKWNGLAHHVASFIFGNTDVVVLTLFSSLQNVSVYSVYLLVVSGLNRLYATCLTGAESVFGRLYAEENHDKLKNTFSIIEWISHNAVVFLFSNAAVLMLDFVRIYTLGVDDINYIHPAFSCLIIASYGLCCLRNVYNVLICAAGHFKQTQWSSIIEAALNLGISLLLVRRFQLVGIAIGTFLAILYQLVYYFIYLHRNVIYIAYRSLVKLALLDCAMVGIITYVGKFLPSATNYRDFLVKGVESVAISVVVIAIVNCIFNNLFIRIVMRKIFKRGDR